MDTSDNDIMDKIVKYEQLIVLYEDIIAGQTVISDRYKILLENYKNLKEANIILHREVDYANECLRDL